MLPDGVSIMQLLLRAVCQLAVDLLLFASQLAASDTAGKPKLGKPNGQSEARDGGVGSGGRGGSGGSAETPPLAGASSPPGRTTSEMDVDVASDAALLAEWISGLTATWIAGGHPLPHALRPAALLRPHLYEEVQLLKEHEKRTSREGEGGKSPSLIARGKSWNVLSRAGSQEAWTGRRADKKAEKAKATANADDVAGLSAHQIAYEMHPIGSAGGGAPDAASRVGGFWCIPRVKFALRGTLECAFLALLARVLLFSHYRSLGLAESALYLWVGALTVDEYYQFLVKAGGSLRVHLADHWNKGMHRRVAVAWWM